MTPLFGPRQRAEEFAALVDGTDPRAVSGDDLDRELAQLLGAADALRSHAHQVAPRAEFSADLRTRLLAEAETVMTPEAAVLRLPTRPRGKRERRLVAAASAAIVLGGSFGMAAAAERALPGEALYPVKRGIERIDVTLSTSPQQRGRDLLDQARVRLDEARDLASAGTTLGAPRIPGTVDDFSSQARAGADLMLESYRETQDPQTISSLREAVAADADLLESLAQSAPEEAADSIAAAFEVLQAIDTEAEALCGECGDLPPLQLSRGAADALGAAASRSEAERVLANLESRRVAVPNNDHPVPVNRFEVPVDQREGPAAPAQAPTAQPSGAAGAPAGGTAGGSTGGGLPLLGGSGGGSGGSGGGSQGGKLGGAVKQTTKDVDKTVDDVVGGVGGVVGGVNDGLGTILPDPKSDLLP